MGRREDPPTLIIHLSDARWCVSLFFPFFGVTNIPLLRPTRAFERAEKKFDRARKRFIATRTRTASAQTFLIDKSIYVWREKLRENKEVGDGGSKSKRWRESHYLGGYFVRVPRRATPADRPIRLQRAER